MFTRKQQKPAPRRVRVLVDRKDNKTRWLIGTVIGKKTCRRTNTSPFGQAFNLAPAEVWTEDKLLVRLSVGGDVQRWDSEVFEVV